MRTKGAGLIGRRGVLGGIAALPVVYGFGKGGSAAAATSMGSGSSLTTAADAAADPAISPAADDLVSGRERRYHAPLLAPGTRLVLPEGVRAVSVLDYYRRPHLASTDSVWPHVIAADGTTVDASVIPGRGAASRVAVLSGFTHGWYNVLHADGRADHVAWDAAKLPVLWMYAEFGATDEAPYRDRFFVLALQPFSRNPYSRRTPAR
ncbi:hypothetical protein [Catenulispora rubra]|uniref:hypothetical protein n=1 Tax=Catenulispora rubra TaxID=280293 RepID=UPI0018925127|nr:hypothetical protein [Catenulispora rubra]